MSAASSPQSPLPTRLTRPRSKLYLLVFKIHVSVTEHWDRAPCTNPFPFTRSGSALRRACFCYALLSTVPVSAYIVMVTALRYHLFIWSVFSPKLLYEGMHLLVTATLCLCFTAVDRAGAKADAGRRARC